jgi:hypothetical protein
MGVGSPFAKYLQRYAEPEARAVPRLAARHHAALVVPAFAESESLLDGYRTAARSAAGRIIVILVVNAPASASTAEREANAELLRSLRARARFDDGEFVFVEEPEFSLLVLDRASPGRELEKKFGVGHARKIGADVALALFARGELELPFLFSTDADAVLPEAYFSRLVTGESAGALLYPFEHVESSDRLVFEATMLYELSLRYHVLGLAFAGSPYAYQSVGSILAASYEAYAAVRGFPKRAAGEDFYLLDKIGKVLPIRRVAGDRVRIHSRRSLRVPFGTGPRVERLLTETSAPVDHPATYRALASLLGAFDEFAETRDERVFASAFGALPSELSLAAEAAVRELRVCEAARDALGQVGTGDLRRRLHTWFDGLRTLRFLHTVGAHGFPKMPCRDALAEAPLPPISAAVPLAIALANARKAEEALPIAVGPTLWTMR